MKFNFDEKFIKQDPNKEQPGQEKKYLIPEEEILKFFSRSSGPGGQKVNKVETRVTLRWNVNNSLAFNEKGEMKIKNCLKNRLTKDGDLIITCQKTRSQSQNLEIARNRLNDLISKALEPKKIRVPTKSPKSAKEKRLKEKMYQKEKKERRSKIFSIENL